MAIVQVLFVCKPSRNLSAEQLTAEFEVKQIECSARNMGGFFLSGPDKYIGFFEAEEDVVIDQIERLVRERKFQNIEVLREIVPRERSCEQWMVSDLELTRIDARDFLSQQHLAEFISSTLKPLSKRQRQ